MDGKKIRISISGVERGSLAATAGIAPGDRLVRVNGKQPRDLLDYRFLCARDRVLLEVERDAERRRVRLAKHPDQDLGLGFADSLFEPVRRCRNRCRFCFVDQLPAGLRRSLYLKDDDYRLSFLHGNFVTLTNLRREDWARLRRQRLSPLYVSVHATDGAARAALMGNPRAARIMEDLSRLLAAGITVHAQVVLCPGINDGAVLERTVKDLSALWPGVASVALVPVAATERAAEGLHPWSPLRAAALIRWAAGRQREFLERFGDAFIHLADEFYLGSGRGFPPLAWYGEFPHLENGVGLVPKLRRDFRRVKPAPQEVVPSLVITGELAAPVLRKLLGDLPGVEVLAVENRLFGTGVNVAGLLGGREVARALAGVSADRRVILPASALREGRFLDEVTAEDLAGVRSGPVVVAAPTGAGLAAALRGADGA